MASNQSQILELITLIIVVVAVAIPISINMLASVTAPTYVINETATMTNNTYITLAHYPIDLTQATGIVVINATLAPLTLNQNYSYAKSTANLNANGTLYLMNVASGYGQGKITYAYQQPSYDTSSTDRTILGIIPLGLAVIGIVLVFNTVIGITG